jgi:elongation factor Ts
MVMRVSDISAAQVAALRKATGAGMMDAKRALQDAGGDMDRAAELLRERGIADASKRAGRSTDQGTIGHYLHVQAERPVIGVLVELASETDFVAKSEEFQAAARDLAMHVAAARPRWVRREDVPGDVLDGERKVFATQARNEGKPEKIIDRIVEGKLQAFYADTVLFDQTFVNTERFEGTVGEMVTELAAKMGENISVRRFVRFSVGESDS